jgi:hypothetical protein
VTLFTSRSTSKFVRVYTSRREDVWVNRGKAPHLKAEVLTSTPDETKLWNSRPVLFYQVNLFLVPVTLVTVFDAEKFSAQACQNPNTLLLVTSIHHDITSALCGEGQSWESDVKSEIPYCGSWSKRRDSITGRNIRQISLHIHKQTGFEHLGVSSGSKLHLNLVLETTQLHNIDIDGSLLEVRARRTKLAIFLHPVPMIRMYTSYLTIVCHGTWAQKQCCLYFYQCTHTYTHTHTHTNIRRMSL